MGAYCDGRLLNNATSKQVLNTVIRPVVERTGFMGFLYAGLMMTADGPKVLEFNVRLGDPETQALMHRMRSDLGGDSRRGCRRSAGRLPHRVAPRALSVRGSRCCRLPR